jgi:hypothetical protein
VPDADFYIGQGDTASAIQQTLETATGAAVNLTGASVKFTMQPINGGAVKISGAAATIVAPNTNGVVKYSWQAADTDTAGWYVASWEVTYADATKQTFPNDSPLVICITADLPLAADHNYVTLATAKRTLEVQGSAYLDQDLQAALGAASRAIDEMCSTRFYTTAADEVRYFNLGRAEAAYGWPMSMATRTQRIKTGDLISITELATDANGAGTYQQVWGAAEYFLEPYNNALDGKPYRMIARNPRATYLFPSWPRGIRITGKFGWTAPPAQVVDACTLLASRLLKRKREAPFGIVSIGIDTAARIARTDPDVQALLQPFMGASFA